MIIYLFAPVKVFSILNMKMFKTKTENAEIELTMHPAMFIVEINNLKALGL